MAWKTLCAAGDAPEDGMREFDIDGARVLLVHTEGRYFAIPPLCPHMEEPLSTGICDGLSLICLKHLWQWDLETGEAVGEAEIPLLRYELMIAPDGSVQIDYDRELRYRYQE